MSNTGKQPPQRQYTQSEQHKSFVGRRLSAFTHRSRDPGDATTWAVVLGSVMGTLLIICFSVASQAEMALLSFALTVFWAFVVSKYGRVSITPVLWGAATTDADIPPNQDMVFKATTLLAILSLLAVIADAFTGWGFRWYGLALLAVVLVYIGIVFRSWISLAR